jgi:prepilin-type N-terminal cleavage/methylation domain-containing protein
MKRNKFKLGFTLIELLTVIGVISVLATVLVTAINPAEMARKSRDSKRLSDLGTLRRAIDLAISDNQPLTATGVVNINSSTSVTNFAGSGLNLSKYIPFIPQDPSYSAAGGSTQVIATGCTAGSITKDAFTYKFWTDGDTYILRANLESLSSCATAENDGNNNSTYETGTEPGLDAF